MKENKSQLFDKNDYEPIASLHDSISKEIVYKNNDLTICFENGFSLIPHTEFNQYDKLLQAIDCHLLIRDFKLIEVRDVEKNNQFELSYLLNRKWWILECKHDSANKYILAADIFPCDEDAHHRIVDMVFTCHEILIYWNGQRVHPAALPDAIDQIAEVESEE